MPGGKVKLLLALDPGIRGSGVAVFDASKKELHHACYVKNPNDGNGPAACAAMALAIVTAVNDHYKHEITGLAHLALEWPKVYAAGKGKGDPNDLIALAGIGAALVSTVMMLLHSTPEPLQITHYYPRDWKGTVDADVMLDRIEARLTPAEAAKIQRSGALTHNIIDAVGIGLFTLGRLNPTKVYARG